MEGLRIGIIGAGRLASSRLYPCLHTLPITLAAVCDLDRDRAEHNAARFGGKVVYTDHERMLAHESLDAVLVCVGPEGHARLAVAAMEAGLPVYTEKPPALDAAAAREMWRVSRRTGKLCMTGFKKRFAPAYRKAKAAAESATFGPPSLLSIDYSCGPTYTNDPADPRSQFLLDFCVHIIDLARYLAGEVAEVYARTHDGLTYTVNLGFRNGALGVLALSATRAWAVPTEKVELTGQPGQFLQVDNSVEYLRYSGDTVAEWHRPSFSTARGDSLVETGFQPELAAFIAAVQSGCEPESSIRSSYRTMLLFEAIRDAAASGKVVSVRDGAGDDA